MRDRALSAKYLFILQIKESFVLFLVLVPKALNSELSL